MRQAILALAAAVDRNTEAVCTAVNRLADAVLNASGELGKEGKKGKVPLEPPKGIKPRKACVNTNARAREAFVKPTVEEVAAHIAEKGYSFSAEAFWNFYESNGWRVGSHAMKSWKSACVTWQENRNESARREAERTAHIDAKMDEREAERRRLADSRREPDPEEARRANIDRGLKLIDELMGGRHV